MSLELMGAGTPSRHRLTERRGAIPGTHAYCDSDKCRKTVIRIDKRGYRFKARRAAMVIKFVEPGTFSCPDCKATLYWWTA